MTKRKQVECKACKEYILEGATKCKHCGHNEYGIMTNLDWVFEVVVKAASWVVGLFILGFICLVLYSWLIS